VGQKSKPLLISRGLLFGSPLLDGISLVVSLLWPWCY